MTTEINRGIRDEDIPEAWFASPAVAVTDALPPSPDQIDYAITVYESCLIDAKFAQSKVDEAKTQLIVMVDSFGSVPAHAEQSKRLSGRHNVATVTRGTTVTVNDAAVFDLDQYLSKVGYYELFSKFFVKQTKYSLMDGAREVLKSVKLPRRIEEKIASLFGRAIDVKSKSPSLKVETIQPEKPARKPRAGKAAA